MSKYGVEIRNPAVREPVCIAGGIARAEFGILDSQQYFGVAIERKAALVLFDGVGIPSGYLWEWARAFRLDASEFGDTIASGRIVCIYGADLLEERLPDTTHYWRRRCEHWKTEVCLLSHRDGVAVGMISTEPIVRTRGLLAARYKDGERRLSVKHTWELCPYRRCKVRISIGRAKQE